MIEASDILDYRNSQATSAHSSGVKYPLIATGFCALVLMSGTGGALTVSLSKLAATAEPTAISGRIEPGERKREEDEIVETAESVVFVQHYLSLTFSDLAAVLKVSRPTIYAWIRGESEPHDQNLIRIQELYEIAKIWASRSMGPMGKLIHMPFTNSESLFTILCQDRIDERSVCQRIEDINRALIVVAAQSGDRLSAADVARNFGFNRASKRLRDQAREEIDL